MIVKGISLQEDQYKVGFRSGSDMSKKVNNLILDMLMDGTLATIAKKYDLVDIFTPLRTSDAGYIMEKGKLIVGYEGTLPPLSYYDKDDQLIGFDIDFAKVVCQELGIDVEFQIINWSQKETELKNRNIDCIWNGLTVTEERRENIKFSRIYMSNKQVVVIKKSDASKYTDLKSLSQSNISVEFDTTGESIAKMDQYLSKANHIAYSSQNEAILALKNGVVDAAVIDYTSAISNISNGNGDIRILEELMNGKETYAIGFRLNSDMTIKINQIISNMINDGSLALIAEKYDLIELYNLTIKNNGKSDYKYIMSKGEMIIGIGVEGIPMVYYDEYGDLTGYDIELAKAICSKLGIDATFKRIEWDKKETELSSKNIDCVWNSLTVTEERNKYFKFTDPYLSNKQIIVIRKSDESKFKDMESLKEATISAVLGTISEDLIKNDPYLSKANYVSSPTQEEAINELINKGIDALVIDYSLAKGIIDNSNHELTIIQGIQLQDELYAGGFRVDSDMPDKINDMIMDMILDDTITEIAKNYNLIDLFTPVKITDASYIINKGKMVIGYDKTLAPMTYVDKKGQLTGFDIEFAKAVCKELDIDAEFNAIDWNMKENELKKRSIDCIWGGLSVTEKLREKIKFSRVYMNNKQVVVIRKANVLKYNNIESISEKKISSKTGTLGEEAILTHFPLSDYKGYLTFDELFMALDKGEVDAIVTDYTIAKHKINNDDFDELMIVEKIILMDDQYAVGFRHGSDMSKKINVIINNMIEDGTLNEIAKKYDLLNLYKSEQKTNITIVVYLLMALYFVLIIVF
ncbi:hypothetical protein PIROE2DRAFT_15535 [Piromyces sp. E2]|nr:hypothetical protein PIROE2DRAFT_15535 [Piromyces sp. E2]|eukprot:OUM59048.1 hypothetical protein PIROE2DRAFT_15535 [Piromyces sp. E2]